MPEARRGLLRRDRDFRWFWVGQTLSVAGTQITAIALPLVAAITLGAGALGAVRGRPGPRDAAARFGRGPGDVIGALSRRRNHVARLVFRVLAPMAGLVGRVPTRPTWRPRFGRNVSETSR